MSTSMNGWPASPALLTRTIVVAGVSFRIADNADVETVFTYVIGRYDETVEPLRAGQCGGFNYRPNVNDPSKLSNHSSGTAVDINSEQHPNAKPTLSTMSAAKVAACHAILASVPELSDCVHWGGDWATPLTTDAMHWELHSHDLALLARVADRIREAAEVTDDDIEKIAQRTAELVLAAGVDKDGRVSVKQALNQIRNAVAKVAGK